MHINVIELPYENVTAGYEPETASAE